MFMEVSCDGYNSMTFQSIFKCYFFLVAFSHLPHLRGTCSLLHHLKMLNITDVQNANPKLLPCVHFPVRVIVISSNFKSKDAAPSRLAPLCGIACLLHLHPHPPFNPSLYSSQSQEQQLVQPRVCHDHHQHEWDRSQFVDVQIKDGGE